MLDARVPRLVILAALVALSAACRTPGETGSGPAPKSAASGTAARRLVLLNNGNSPFWDACRLGLQEAARDLKLADVGLSVVMEVNDGTVQGQIDRLRQLSNMRDVAGVAISALDADNAAVA